MNLFDVVAPHWRIAATAGLAVMSGVYGWHKGADSIRAEWKASQADQNAIVQRMTAQTLQIEHAAQAKTSEVDHDTQAKLDAARADAARSAADARSLRDTIADLHARAMSAEASRSGLIDAAGAAADLLGQCSERYSAVAGEADRLAIQVAGWQALP